MSQHRTGGAAGRMPAGKRRRLEAAGFAVGSAEDFLGLSEEERAFVEVRLSLARHLRDRRTDAGLTQAALAKRIGSSQSRVAKMEAADTTVAIDLLIRALFALGASRRDVGRAVAMRTA